jgi:hypothetical protein
MYAFVAQNVQFHARNDDVLWGELKVALGHGGRYVEERVFRRN